MAQNPINYWTSATYIGGYHIKCNGQNTGSIKANPNFGTAPHTFLWNTGETTAQINNKGAGIYYVTMTDSLNVSYTDTFELRQPYALSYQSTLSDYYGYNISTHGGSDGGIQLSATGGTPPYRYNWNNGDSVANRRDLTAGTYSFTITDANQCSTAGSYTLTAPNPIQVSFSNIEQLTCFKSNDGKATLNISGGLGNYSVVWENGSFSLSPEDLLAGYNEVRIYEHGTEVMDTGITLTQPDVLDIQFAYSDYNGYHVSCVDCFNGTVAASVTGGTAPYTYQWEDANNSTTSNLSNLNGGDYPIKVTDAKGCKMGNTAQLSMPTPKDWSRHGNANIDTSEFIGSTDTSAVVFKANNEEVLRIKNDQATFKSKIRLMNIDTMTLFSNTSKFIAIDNNGNLKAFRSGDILEGLILGPLGCSNCTCSPVLGWGHSADMINGVAVPIISDDIIKCPIEGNVGIGTNLPEANSKLDIYGEIAIHGERLRVTYDGKVGIGTPNPTQKLEIKHNDIKGGILINKVSSDAGNNSEIKFNKNGNQLFSLVCDLNNTGSQSFYIWSNISNNVPMIINESGKVGIGGYYPPINNSIYKLYVEGGIVTRDVKVMVGPMPDYVFNNTYPLMSIGELDNFIQKNNHLPGIASAKEIEQNEGFEVGEMQRIMLEKLEEQTLYIILLQKQIDELKKIVSANKK